MKVLKVLIKNKIQMVLLVIGGYLLMTDSVILGCAILSVGVALLDN